MAKHPTKQQITADIAKDLRHVYLVTFDQFATDVSEVALEVGDNTRYARELLGVLTHHNMVGETEDGDGKQAYQVINPGTYDNVTRDEAEAAIDAFLATHLGTKAPTAKKAKSNGGSAATTVSAEGSPCLCGCGEPTGKKSNYRPGHDARHAGEVGRAIAAEFNTPGFDRRTLLDALPSDLLKAKAEAIAEKAIEKAQKKSATSAPAEPEADIEGIITVGKAEVAAVRKPDGTIERVDGKAVSKTAASTFEPA